jgi:predicted ATPase/DNA-binding XRE family transcriptional regulator
LSSPDRDRPSFGTILRRLRLNAELSQEALAERAGISVQAVSALEQGARSSPQRHTLQALVTALRLEADDEALLESAGRDSAKRRVRHGATPRRRLPQRDLPSVPTSFLGREAEIAAIVALLERGGTVSIWGPGGVGKTRVAIEVAKSAREQFPDGVFFLELASFVDAAGISSALAAAIGFTVKPDGDIADVVSGELADARALIVLDNCEHMIEDAARFAGDLLAHASAVGLLCTTREPLRIAGEHVFELGSLALPRAAADLPAVRASVATRLFLDRATSAGGVCMDDACDLGAIATICRRLDGIPLAIELAAARTRTMDVSTIASVLGDRFVLLDRGHRTAPSRQQTLAGALDWSYDLLRPEEQVVFRRLSVLAGTWTLDDAWGVARGPADERWTIVDLVCALIDKALVAVVPSATGRYRYRMLESTREYAVTRLRESGELAACERIHAQHVRATALDGQSPWSVGIVRDPSARIDAENVRAALEWSITRGNDPAFGGALAGAVSVLWDELGQNEEGVRWIDEAIASFSPSDTSPAVVEAWLARARLANALLRYRDGFETAERAILLADRVNATTLRVAARALSAYAASRIGEHDVSERRIDEAAALLERDAVEGGRTWTRYVGAFAAFQRGRNVEARCGFERVVAAYRAAGDARSALSARIDLAEAEYVLGNRSAAIERAREAAHSPPALGEAGLLISALANASAYLLDAEDIVSAAAAAYESCTRAFDRRNANLTAIAILYCACVGARRGMTREAAMLAGYVDRTHHGYTEARAYDRLMLYLLEQLGESTLDDARASGAILDEDEAVRSALRIAGPVAIDGEHHPPHSVR